MINKLIVALQVGAVFALVCSFSLAVAWVFTKEPILSSLASLSTAVFAVLLAWATDLRVRRTIKETRKSLDAMR